MATSVSYDKQTHRIGRPMRFELVEDSRQAMMRKVRCVAFHTFHATAIAAILGWLAVFADVM